MGSHKFAVFENFSCAYLHQIVSEMLLPILIYHPLVTLMLHASLRTPPPSHSPCYVLDCKTCLPLMYIVYVYRRNPLQGIMLEKNYKNLSIKQKMPLSSYPEDKKGKYGLIMVSRGIARIFQKRIFTLAANSEPYQVILLLMSISFYSLFDLQ